MRNNEVVAEVTRHARRHKNDVVWQRVAAWTPEELKAVVGRTQSVAMATRLARDEATRRERLEQAAAERTPISVTFTTVERGVARITTKRGRGTFKGEWAVMRWTIRTTDGETVVVRGDRAYNGHGKEIGHGARVATF